MIIILLGNLKNPICVVDPSEGLINEAKKRSNVIPVVATADQFFASCKRSTYDRILFSQSVHHLPDCKATFEVMYDILPVGSRCVIVGASKATSLPLWKSVRENFGSNMTEEVLSLKSCGFSVVSSESELVLRLTKKEWYDKIRKRIFSPFTPLSADEIEEGIQEVDKTLLCNAKQDEAVEMTHNLQCIVATKL